MVKKSTNPNWLKIKAQRASRDEDFRLSLRDSKKLPEDKPTMFVEVTIGSQRGTPTQKLSRAAPFDLSYTAPPGRYACFPAWDWKTDLLPKEEETVEVRRVLLESVLETFRTGVIQDDVEKELKELLSRK